MRVLGSKAQGARLERIQASPRFDGEKFRNTFPVPEGLEKGKAIPTLKEFVFGKQRRVPAGALPIVDPLASWSRPVQSGLRATWLGHSTVLLEIDGMRVLTDPVWGARVSPFSFAGPKRFHPVPVDVARLPSLDAILVSHDHYDHLDYPTILQLIPLRVPFITSLGVGAHLEAWGVPPELIIELDWWESHSIGGLTFTAAPSQHFSGRSVSDRNRTAWSSFVVRGSHHAVFFSGDTGLTDEYVEIGQRLGPFDLVMLEVGAWGAAWGHIHLGPENALKAHALLGSGAFLPVHWGTFNLAIHAWDEPAEVLVKLAPTNALLIMPRLGQPIEPHHVQSIDPWWREVEQTETAAAPIEAVATPAD